MNVGTLGFVLVCLVTNVYCNDGNVTVVDDNFLTNHEAMDTLLATIMNSTRVLRNNEPVSLTR